MLEDDSIEIQGATEEEAVQRACEALNTRMENLGYEITKGGKGGLMGLMRSKKNVTIKAWRKDLRGEETNTPVNDFIKEALNVVLSTFCEQVDVEIMEYNEEVNVQVTTDEGGLVIGKNGQTLDSLQYLIRRMVNKKFADFDKQIVLNTEGYRERKQEALTSLVKKIAKKVRSSQKKQTLRPMNAYERRLVHMTLKSETGVSTKSRGEGSDRCIVIFPEKLNRRSKNDKKQTSDNVNDAVKAVPSGNV